MRTGRIIAFVVGLMGAAATGTGAYALAGGTPCSPVCVAPGWLIGLGAPTAVVAGIVATSPIMLFTAFAAVGFGLLAAAVGNGHQSVQSYFPGGLCLLIGLGGNVVWFAVRNVDITDGRAALFATGRPGLATLLSLTDAGGSVNDNPEVIMRVRIEPADGSPAFDSTRTLVVSRLAVPRPGQRLAVYYDPADRDRFVLVTEADGEAPDEARRLLERLRAESAPAATPTVDPVERLGKLNALRLSGALTEEEFQRQKAKLDL
ncbi:SHOCT domain-containing protein [Dactylosporangium sp. NPDC049140]|jgi:hypothetical protein|uniref:SHOCT domain-containing protein n=1 Tax=Dactylosporangium sp. NPDC049140 TaxID=3155647 RepID=UPI003410F177